MPGNAFVLFEAAAVLPGESTHDTHPGSSGWNEISDWSWDIEADTSFLKGSGAAVGKPTPGNFSITKPYDKVSPAIMLKIVQGTSFKQVKLVMLKQTGAESGKGEPYFGATFKDAFITKVSSKGGEDGSVSQDIEFVFKDCSIGYKPQKNDGTLDNSMFFGWDISKMKTEGVTNTDTVA
jgi:type VI secretion system secreted protein Hcp